MNLEIGALLEMVYPLADNLQIRLGLYTPKNKKESIKGLPTTAIKYPLTSSDAISMKMDVKASFINDDYSAILVRVLGDLYLYEMFDREQSKISIFILNAGALPFTPQVIAMIDGLHPKQAIILFKISIKAIYVKIKGQQTWAKQDGLNVNTVNEQ